MNQRGEVLLAVLVVLLIVAGVTIFVWFSVRQTVSPPVEQQPVTRVPLTVLPTQTPYSFATATLAPVPTLGDLLPMTPTTREPTVTRVPTPEPTMTPTVRPSQAPVQKG